MDSIERERVPAAVILIIFLIGGIVVYLIMIPSPVAYSLIFGNFSQQQQPTPPPTATPVGSFYYPLSSYVGGNSAPAQTFYSMGTFGVAYSLANSTIGTSKPFTLTSSIFGSSSYNIGFNGSPSDLYFVTINISSVSGGNPKLKLSLNGGPSYTTTPSGGEIIHLPLSPVRSGKNILSLSNELNGFAFSQSIRFNSVTITQTSSLNTSKTVTTTVQTFSGLGNYYLQYTPIGSGTMSISINGNYLTQVTSASDVPQNVTIPAYIINKIIGTGTSPVMPLTFNVAFTAAKQSSYQIANAGILYQSPVIPSTNITIPLGVKSGSGNYIMTFYVNSIIKQGAVYFTFYPSGQEFQIPSTNLVVGQNVVILPSSALAGQVVSGNYSGTVYVSSNGLVLPQYLSIKPAS